MQLLPAEAASLPLPSRKDEDWRYADSEFLAQASPDAIHHWRTLDVTAGCDRRFDTCKAKFGNAVNFRGFPHIPGSDYVLRHPRNGDALDGRAVVP